VLDLVVFGCDEMRHVRCFGGIDHKTHVRADRHSLRFDTDGDLGLHGLLRRIDDRYEIIVFVRDVEPAAVWIDDKQFRVRPGRQGPKELVGLGVEDLDRVIIGCADVDMFSVRADANSPRPVSGRKLGDSLPAFAVDNRNRVALFVADKDLVGERGSGGQNAANQQDSQDPPGCRRPVKCRS
jgi:hypothetical protein